MKVLNFGSLNVDYVYAVDHIVEGGETLLTAGMETFCGGKGLNQSIALSKAGAQVFHAGIIGTDGAMLKDECDRYGVDTRFIKTLEVKGGHTIIQVDKHGQNCILLYGGTNQMFTKEYIDEVLEHFGKEDILILQNEVNLLDYMIEQAGNKGMRIVLNPSPFNEKLSTCDLTKIWCFMINEIEGYQFSGEKEADKILDVLTKKYPKAKIVLTLGEDGAWFAEREKRCYQAIFPVKAVDTTAAGDTFTGYFVESCLEGKDEEYALRLASKASSIAVTRAGAAVSIPMRQEVEI